MFSQKQSFIKGAIIISIGGFVSKLLGAIYRVPLTNFLGGVGMGISFILYIAYGFGFGNSYRRRPINIVRQRQRRGEAGVFAIRRNRSYRHVSDVYAFGSSRFGSAGACNKTLLYNALSVGFFCVRSFHSTGIFSGQRKYVSHRGNGNFRTIDKSYSRLYSRIRFPFESSSRGCFHTVCGYGKRNIFNRNRARMVF